ncbi:MAG: HAD family phosphatase [Simkaniaceae bacterium]|nr:HAD family phosphatase [Simkaniaceae bacterium]
MKRIAHLTSAFMLMASLGKIQATDKVHSMNIKAIIFDCDGILVDSEYAHYLAWQHALQQEGGDLTIEEYYCYVGKSVETNAKLLAEKIGSSHADRIMKNKRKLFHALQNEGLPAIEHVVNFVHRLAKDKQKYGFKLGVASAAKKNEILINLKNLEIDKFFDIVISGYDDLSHYSDPEGVNKPKPYIYLHVAKELGLLPYECVVIEDSLSGVTSGVNAGCITIAVPNDYTRHQDLSTGNVKLDSFAKITSYEDFLFMLASPPTALEQ